MSSMASWGRGGALSLLSLHTGRDLVKVDYLQCAAAKASVGPRRAARGDATTARREETRGETVYPLLL